MHYVKSYKALFTTPKKYFKSLNKPSLQHSYTFYLLFYLSFFALTIIFDILTYFFTPTQEEIFTLLAVPFIAGLFFLSLVAGLLLPVFLSVLTHAGVYFVSHKENFTKTFDATTRSHTILVTYSLINSFLVMFLAAFFFGTPIYVLLLGLISIVTMSAGLIHYLYAVSEGLHVFHNISVQQSVLSVILIPAAFIMLVVILLILAVLA